VNEPVVLEAGALRIGFAYAGDRWGHWIEPACFAGDRLAQPWTAESRLALPSTAESRLALPSTAGEVSARLESLEGQPDDPWPASPALQSLHVEQRGGGIVVALLVGMAGSSHWSLSVEANAQLHRATFDVACRTRAEPAWLGSTYSLSPDFEIAENCLLDAAGRRLQVTPDAPHVPTVLTFSQRRLSLVPERTALPGKAPQTIRWRYSIGCS
jgi:hypothetical protein